MLICDVMNVAINFPIRFEFKILNFVTMKIFLIQNNHFFI